MVYSGYYVFQDPSDRGHLHSLSCVCQRLCPVFQGPVVSCVLQTTCVLYSRAQLSCVQWYQFLPVFWRSLEYCGVPHVLCSRGDLYAVSVMLCAAQVNYVLCSLGQLCPMFLGLVMFCVAWVSYVLCCLGQLCPVVLESLCPVFQRSVMSCVPEFILSCVPEDLGDPRCYQRREGPDIFSFVYPGDPGS